MKPSASKIFRHFKWRGGLAARRMANRVSKFYWQRRQKKISVMMRVQNEEEFLVSSVLSIANLVDEIVIIDGLSTDNTPGIIVDLKRNLGSKVHAYDYPIKCARAGEEYQALQRDDPKSPGLLHNFYNWCLARCTMPFVMKWDGDMLAMAEFAEAIERFKASNCLQFDFGGINVAPDFRHVLSPSAVVEPRVFPKMFSKFSYRGDVGETLGVWVIPECTLVIQNPLYLHMKYCKAKPDANFSEKYSRNWMSKLKTAGTMPPGAIQSLEKCLAHQAGC